MLYIFDWDGTVCDSTGKIVSCMQTSAKELGLPILDDETIKNIIGLGLPEALSTLYPDLSPDAYPVLKACYSKHFLQTQETVNDLFPEALNVLHNLKDQGYRLSVATGKSRAGLDRVLGLVGLDTFFDDTITACETQSKPHPEMLSVLLQRFNCEAQNAVMVGDTEYDMAMAHVLGMPKIAVSYGAHAIERMHKYDPQLCIDNFCELTQWSFDPSK